MLRQRLEVLHCVGDNALISEFGKGPIPYKNQFEGNDPDRMFSLTATSGIDI